MRSRSTPMSVSGTATAFAWVKECIGTIVITDRGGEGQGAAEDEGVVPGAGAQQVPDVLRRQTHLQLRGQ